MLLFPHLIAGPIVRHNELVPQFDEDPRREGLWMRIGIGLVHLHDRIRQEGAARGQFRVRWSIGLFTQATKTALSFGDAWTAVLKFLPAVLRLLGLYRDGDRDRAAVRAVAAGEFPAALHCHRPAGFLAAIAYSLSKFLRDYLYIPLGGSRAGPARYVLATMLTMGLCGLWHGAGWTYVFWGLWHGVGLVVCHGWQRLGRPMPALVGWAVTMLFVAVGWIVFRADTFGTATSIVSSMAGLNGFGGVLLEAS